MSFTRSAHLEAVLHFLFICPPFLLSSLVTLIASFCSPWTVVQWLSVTDVQSLEQAPDESPLFAYYPTEHSNLLAQQTAEFLYNGHKNFIPSSSVTQPSAPHPIHISSFFSSCRQNYTDFSLLFNSPFLPQFSNTLLPSIFLSATEGLEPVESSLELVEVEILLCRSMICGGAVSVNF